jgi:hypothetical protein
MAAGLGFKDFVTGEVLTAADVDGYLMQGIWVFASAAARDAAVTSPQEGNACYLKDTNQVLTYSGSAWVAVGGGSPLTTKGDVYGFSTVDARIPIGANDTVLTADSTQALGLKWAAPAGGSYTSLATGSCSGTSTTVNITTTGYKQIVAYLKDVTCAADYYAQVRLNGDSANYGNLITRQTSATAVTNSADNDTDSIWAVSKLEATAGDNFQIFTIQDPASTTTHKLCTLQVVGRDGANTFNFIASVVSIYRSTSAITSIAFAPGETFSTGTYEIYGVK